MSANTSPGFHCFDIRLAHAQERGSPVGFSGRVRNYRASRKIARQPETQSRLARPRGTSAGAYEYVIGNQAAKRLLSILLRRPAFRVDKTGLSPDAQSLGDVRQCVDKMRVCRALCHQTAGL